MAKNCSKGQSQRLLLALLSMIAISAFIAGSCLGTRVQAMHVKSYAHTYQSNN